MMTVTRTDRAAALPPFTAPAVPRGVKITRGSVAAACVAVMSPVEWKGLETLVVAVAAAFPAVRNDPEAVRHAMLPLCSNGLADKQRHEGTFRWRLTERGEALRRSMPASEPAPAVRGRPAAKAPFEIEGPLTARSLFAFERAAREGMPAFADLKAVRLPVWKERREAFMGPGVYGLFLRGKLFYVGIYKGSDGRAFSGSVSERWLKHLTFMTLRSPETAMAPASMERVLRELDGPPVDAFAALLGGRGMDAAAMETTGHPLVNGRSVQFNKVRFAVENWDSFAPGREEAMLDEVSFVYARFLPAALALLEGVAPARRAGVVKNEWLAPREARLVKALRPACNAFVKEPLRDVTVAEFVAALGEEMSRPLPAVAGAGVEGGRS